MRGKVRAKRRKEKMGNLNNEGQRIRGKKEKSRSFGLRDTEKMR